MRYEDASGAFQASGPIANDDSDTLPAGSRTPATGNLITGEGTQYASAGADSAAGGHIVSIAGKGGEDSSFSGGKLGVAGEFGQLTVDAQGNYSYLANKGAPENVRDRFTYTLADNQGNKDTAALIVEIGKTPVVIKANAEQIVPGPDGVVTLPPGVELSDIMVVGRNLVINMPDGTQLIIVDGAVFVPQLVLGGVEIPATNVAALLIGQEPQPAAGETPPSSGGNFALPPPPLDPGVPLGDLLPPTEYVYNPPEPREVLPEEVDEEPTITIEPDGQPASVAAVDSVNEAGLPTRNGGEPEGSGEEAAAGANGDPSEATTGIIHIDSPDGIGSVTINGVTVTGNVGQQIAGTYGVLTITGFVGSDIQYSYTLADNSSGNDTQDDFSVTITDLDGDQATATLTIDIVDDVPTARPDTDSIAAGQYGPVTGNVVTDASAGDAGDGDNGRDTVGADNAAVSSVSSANVPANSDGSPPFVVNGQYGVLTLQADGSYSYVRNPGTPGGVNDVFNYTLTDGDGDTSSSTLTISIADIPPSIDVPTAGEAGTQVNEKGLPTRNGGEPAGSGEIADGNGADNDDASETTAGVINFTPGDGPATVRIDGVAVTSVGQTFNGAHGVLTVTAIGPNSISYSYTLTDNTSGNTTFDDFAISVTDQDGDVASGTLTIDIVDDVPTADNDTDLVPAGTYGPETGNVITGVGTTSGAAGDDVVGADNATVTAVTGFGGSSDNTPSGPSGALTVNGQYGVLTINADGSYSYVRNPGTPGGVNDVFTYTLTDGDGDADTATLTISIADSGVTLDAPDQGEAGTLVNEKGLPTRNGGEPAGTGEAADGNSSDNDDTSETTGSTITYTAPDGPATITIDGVAVTSVGQTFNGAHGVLTITSIAAGSIGYSYTLTDNTSGNATFDDFAIQVIDQDGDVANDTLVVNIVDDAPLASPDTDSIASGQYGPATGNVITDAEGDGGKDNVGADNAVVTGVAAGNTGVNFDNPATVGVVIQGAYGKLTLNADGSYSYTRDQGTDGGVQDVFTYTLKDGDGDLVSTTLTITIGDSGVTLDAPDQGEAGTLVDEQGLPTRNGGEPAGTGEAADGNSSDNDDTSETTAGVISFTAPDGPAIVRIDGVVVTGVVGQTFNGAHGVLTITSYNAATGQIGYSYTLGDNTSGDATFDDFAIQVEDQDGDIANDTLVIDIVDDTPLASPDTDAVPSGTYGPATGNVITDSEGDPDNGADNVGADNAVVTGVAAGNTGANLDNPATVGVVVQGTYGKLTLNADGSYSYVRDPGTDGGVQDIFTYTLKDGDGDLISTTLTITIEDAGVTLDAPDQGEAGTLVNEKGLPTRNGGEPAGTGEIADGNGADNDDTSETTSAVITYTAPDGPAIIRIDGVAVTSVGQTFNGAHGVLTITSIAPGSIGYSYTLGDNTSGNATFDDFAIQVEDQDGDIANDTLVIDIVDDAPIAADDSNSVDEGATVGGNVLPNDVSGADNYDPTGAVVGAVTGNNDAVDTANMVGNQIVVVGTYGTLTLNDDGSYTYDALPNTNPPPGAVDQFVYTIRDGDGDLDSATLTITLRDVTLNATDDDALVNEAGLATGSNPGSTSEIDSNGAITPSGGTGPYTFTLLSPAVGAFGTLTLNPNGTYTYTLTSRYDTDPPANNSTNVEDNRDSFTYQVMDANGNTTTGTIYVDIIDDVPTVDVVGPTSVTEGNSINGTWSQVIGADQPGATTVVVFNGTDYALGTPIVTGKGTLTVLANGTWTFQALNNLDNDALQQVSFSVKVTDGDGDIATDPHTITINDGPPPTNSGPITLEVDDDALSNGNNAASPDEVDSDTITFNAGSDALTVAFGNSVASLGGGLTWTRVSDTVIEGRDGGNLIVTLTLSGTLNIAAGASGVVTVTATLADNYDSHPTFTADDLQALGNVQVVASDQDGDSTSAQVNVQVSDDVPDNDVAGPTTVVEGQSINGTWTAAIGADQPGHSTVVTFNGTDYALGTPIVTGKGTLTVLANGTWTFQALNNLDQDVAQSISFTLKTTDADNDVATDPHTISITDGPPPTVSGPITLEVDDQALSDGSTPGSTAEVDADTLTFTAGSDALTVAFSNNLASLGGGLTWNRVSDTLIEGWDGPVGTGTKIIQLSLSGSLSIAAGANGNVTVTATLLDNYDSHPTFTADDLQALGSVLVVGSDQDGDSISGTVNVQVSDDVPDNDVAGPTTVVEGQSINGTWTAAIGADQPGHSTVVTFNGTDYALGTPIVTGKGTLTVLANGTWTFTALNNLDQDVAQSISFTLKTTDADSDVATDPHTISITDGPPPTGGDTLSLEVDDDALPNGNNAASTDENASGTLTFTAGSDALTGFAFASGTGTLGAGLTWTRVSDTLIEGYDGATKIVSISLVAPGGGIGAGASGDVTINVTLHDNYDSHPSFTADDLVSLGSVTVVASDHDGDTATGTVSVSVSDDVPTLAFGPHNPVVSKTATGTMTLNIGADDWAPSTLVDTIVNVTANGGTVGTTPVALQSFVVNPVPTANTANLVTYSFSFSYDNDPVAAGVQTANGTGSITINKATGQYSVTIDQSVGYTSTVQTNQALSITPYQAESPADEQGAQAEFAVSQLAPNFFVQFYGDHNGLSYAGGSNSPFLGNPGYVSVSGSANGVNSDTIQQNDVLNLDFFTADPGGDSTPEQTRAFAEAVFFQIDNFGNNEDGFIVLKLVDPNNPNTIIYRTFHADNADFYTASTGSPPGYTFTMDNNDAVLVIEANDYRLPTDPVQYVIAGLQWVVSSEGTSGTAYDLNGVPGGSGGLIDLTPSAFGPGDYTDDNDVTKIVNIGFKLTTNTPQPITLNFLVNAVDTDSDSTGNVALSVTFPASVMPVVLDMDGDGAEFLGLEAGVAYDYGNGLVATGWAGPDDAILVRDANGNGTVDGASEFVFGGNGVTDLQALAAQYGSTLDAGDADFAQFGLWQDANSNGAVDAGEYRTLTAAGITSIGLVSDGIAYSAAGGDVAVAGSASYTMANGSTGSLADAAFFTAKMAEDKALTSSSSNIALAAAVAAAGLAESQAAAPASAEAGTAQAAAASAASASASAAASVEDVSRSALSNETVEAANDDAPASSSSPSSNASASSNGLGDGSASSSDELSALAADSDAPAADSAEAAPSVPAVAMASAAPQASVGGSQDGGSVEQIVAEVLADAGAPTVDGLLAGLSAGGGGMAIAELASHGGGAVPAWDMGGNGGYTSGADMMMLKVMAAMQHHDAVQPVANG